MKNMILAATLLSALSVHAVAQTATDPETPAIATPDASNATAPVEGENSFTEDQARTRIAEAGFTGLTGLMLDEKGVWRGTATRDGKSSPVALDYQGNVVAE